MAVFPQKLELNVFQILSPSPLNGSFSLHRRDILRFCVVTCWLKWKILWSEKFPQYLRLEVAGLDMASIFFRKCFPLILSREKPKILSRLLSVWHGRRVTEIKHRRKSYFPVVITLFLKKSTKIKLRQYAVFLPQYIYVISAKSSVNNRISYIWIQNS